MKEVVVIKPFKFLNLWVKHHQFQQVVWEAWKIDFLGNPFTKFHAKMKKVKKALYRWSRMTYKNLFEKVAIPKGIISNIESQFKFNPSQKNNQDLKKSEVELARFQAIQEDYWRQKSSLKWFKDGDRNTNFFHSVVKDRRKRLHISEICDKSGNGLAYRTRLEKLLLKSTRTYFLR